MSLMYESVEESPMSPMYESEEENPSSLPSTEFYRCHFRLAALRFKENPNKFDPLSDRNDITSKRDRVMRDIAFYNQSNARVRAKLSNLLNHFDDLMVELNSRKKYQDKLDYLRSQALLLHSAVPRVAKIRSLQEEELTLNNHLHYIQQLLVAGREETDDHKSTLADLNWIEKKEKSWSHHLAVALPITIAAVATIITALKWRS